MLDTVSTLWPQVSSGKLKALAITTPYSSAIATAAPSYVDAGLKDMSITSWQAIMAPAGTPPSVIDTLNAAINKTLQSPDVIEGLRQNGVTPQGGSPAVAATFINQARIRFMARHRQSGQHGAWVYVVGPAKFGLAPHAHAHAGGRRLATFIWDDSTAPLPRMNVGEIGRHGPQRSVRPRWCARRLPAPSSR